MTFFPLFGAAKIGGFSNVSIYLRVFVISPKDHELHENNVSYLKVLHEINTKKYETLERLVNNGI